MSKDALGDRLGALSAYRHALVLTDGESSEAAVWRIGSAVEWP